MTSGAFAKNCVALALQTLGLLGDDLIDSALGPPSRLAGRYLSRYLFD